MAEATQGGRRLASAGIEIFERAPIACVDLRGQPRDARFMRAVASVTDVPQGTVASRVRRGHELFKKAAARIRTRVTRKEAP